MPSNLLSREILCILVPLPVCIKLIIGQLLHLFFTSFKMSSAVSFSYAGCVLLSSNLFCWICFGYLILVMRLPLWRKLLQSRSGHPRNTPSVSRLSFRFLWLWSKTFELFVCLLIFNKSFGLCGCCFTLIKG